MGRGGERVAREDKRLGPRAAPHVRAEPCASGIDNRARPIPRRVAVVWTLVYLPVALVCFALIVVACFANTALEAIDYAWRGPEDGEALSLIHI